MRSRALAEVAHSTIVGIVLPWLVLSTMGASCDIINSVDGGDVDGDLSNEDADQGGDGDGDGDADGDTDADTDSDTDSDGDSDSDSDSDGDADGDGDVDEGLIGDLVERLESSDSSTEELRGALYDASWGQGWPLHEGDWWLFATEWEESPAAVSLVGDFNSWNMATHPASKSPSGAFYWVLVESADLPAPEGAKYKWWGSPETWRAPPEATAYGYDEFGQHGWVKPPIASPYLERFPLLASAFLDEPRTLRAWLPAGFVPGSPEAAHTRTLLLHDGQNVFHPDAPWGGWRVGEAVVSGGYDDVVVLAVDSVSDRIAAYTPVSDDMSGDGTMVGGDSEAYIGSLREEVLPFFRERYGIEADGASLMVSGSSLGGLVTLSMVIADPEGQACVAALSPSLAWGAMSPTLTGEDAIVNLWSTSVGHGNTAVYLDSGGGPGSGCVDSDGDGVEDNGDDSDGYCATAQLRDELASLGYAFGVDLWHWWEIDAGHNEAAWAERFPQALEACDAAGWQAP